VFGIVMAGAGCWSQTIRADSSSFSPAYWQQSSAELRLFTLDGQDLAAALPREARGLNVVWFSPDGKAIYGQAFHRSTGITKIERKPTRQSIVRGSEGLEAMHLTVSPSADKIFVTGWAVKQDKRECGYFAIDPSAGTVQALRIAPYLDCRLAGPVSPTANTR